MLNIHKGGSLLSPLFENLRQRWEKVICPHCFGYSFFTFYMCWMYISDSILSYLWNPHAFVPENDPQDGNRKCKSTFAYFLFGSSKENYVYDLYHQRKEISKELHQFCLDQGHADHNLIVKGEKVGVASLYADRNLFVYLFICLCCSFWFIVPSLLPSFICFGFWLVNLEMCFLLKLSLYWVCAAR